MVSGYQEARESAAFDERNDRGRVLLSGADARSFLHALVTNDVESLGSGAACYAALLTPQGRMIIDMRVLVSRPDRVLLAVPSDAAAPLAARLDKLIFTEEVEVSDVTASTAQFSVTGPGARALVEPLAGLESWPSDELGIESLDVVVPAERADDVRRELAARAGVLSADARKILRVEAGRPEFGVDMTSETIPLEANLLERAISTSKGCYVGQEVIVRVLHRGGGRVAKKLVRLRFDGSGASTEGAALSVDGREIGRVTSAVQSPREGAIGLGYVHRDFVRDGVQVQVAGGRTATVSEL